MRSTLSILLTCCIAVGCMSEEDGSEVDGTMDADTAESGEATGGVSSTDAELQLSGPWSNFPLICRTCSTHSGNLVKLWQSILWADGFFTSTSDVDGGFGPRTQDATVSWQIVWLPSDGGTGKVGRNTWTRASDFIEFESDGDTCHGGLFRLFYRGTHGRVIRLSENCTTGEWRFLNPNTGQFISV